MAEINITILNVVRDPLPPTRPDVLTLFGKCLVNLGVNSVLIGQYGGEKLPFLWGGGNHYVYGQMRGIVSSALTPFWDIVSAIKAVRNNAIFCIQVRDKIASGLLCLILARFTHKPFVYWMSFPIVEGHELRAKNVGKSKGIFVWLANAFRATVSRKVFYGYIIRNASHIFVQSVAMRDWLARKGFDPERMTAVPMGVDIAAFQRDQVEPSDDARLDGKRAIIYIGSLGKARKSAFLLDLLMALHNQQPDIILILAGDAVSSDERQWIRDEIAKRGLQQHVLLTGWLEQKEALRYAVRARVGLSPIPRGELFDVSSPTKLVEYLALGLPSVANDIPDQQLVIEQSGGGICVPMDIEAFRDAVLRLLADDTFHAQCALAGPPYVKAERAYDVLAERVAETYRSIAEARS